MDDRGFAFFQQEHFNKKNLNFICFVYAMAYTFGDII